MKTAEQWVKEYNKMLPENYGLTQTLIEEIQLDAMKKGMLMAADIVARHGWRNEPQMKHILTTAEQLTEKDI